MYNVTVCIPHMNTPWFLDTCLACIIYHHNPLIKTQVIIADSSSPTSAKTVNSIIDKYRKLGMDIILLSIVPTCAGYPQDMALQRATSEYFCSIHCDTLVINKNWLYLPIELIVKNIAQWVGIDYGLAQVYPHKGQWIQLAGVFRVSKTEIARKVSEDVGFRRFATREKTGFVPKNKAYEQMGGNNDGDNDIVAMWYAENVLHHSKLALRTSGYLGMTPKMGIYGGSLDGLAIHAFFATASFDNMLEILGSECLAFLEKAKKGLTPQDIMSLPIIPVATSRILNGGKYVSAETNALIDKIKAE